MTLPTSLTTILVRMHPSLSNCVRQGRITVKLLKSIYGLKQAALDWHNEVKTTLTRICGLTQSSIDSCLFFNTAECIVMINVHVDDLLVVSNSEDAVAAIHCVLKDKYGQFTMKSNKSSYLGMEIESLADNSVSIKQSGYLKSILDKCEYKSTHVTPSTADFFESNDDPNEDHTRNSPQFKSLLMSLMFLATRTRPDILKEVVYLSSFALNPGPIASNKLNRIVGYLDLGAHENNPTKYLHNVLKSLPDDYSEDTAKQNNVRNAISRFFSSLHCSQIYCRHRYKT